MKHFFLKNCELHGTSSSILFLNAVLNSFMKAQLVAFLSFNFLIITRVLFLWLSLLIQFIPSFLRRFFLRYSSRSFRSRQNESINCSRTIKTSRIFSTKCFVVNILFNVNWRMKKRNKSVTFKRLCFK